jgi:hypothetical protein
MPSTYRAGHRPSKRRGRKLAKVLICSILLVGILGGLLIRDVLKNQDVEPVSGAARSVAQQVKGDSTEKLTINEPLYRLALPGDWKEIDRKKVATEQSITWQAKKKNADNRWLKLYIDTIPPDFAVNRLLPVEASADGSLSFSEISDNCANFTRPGTNEKIPGPSKWQQVNFICDLPNFVQNKVGTGSAAGINTIKISTPDKGEHRYFFLYTDHNIQPDYTILYDALHSFRAK